MERNENLPDYTIYLNTNSGPIKVNVHLAHDKTCDIYLNRQNKTDITWPPRDLPPDRPNI